MSRARRQSVELCGVSVGLLRTSGAQWSLIGLVGSRWELVGLIAHCVYTQQHLLSKIF